ncbi:membrane protein [Beggiatoa sp. PS]|nr:membrane protein [Beggiatoa sp. PS]
MILTRAISSEPIPMIRPSFLDEAVENSMPYVQWASTAFHRNYYDRMVRHWWLWQSACTAQRQPTVIPSMQLLAATLIRNGISQQENFEKTLQSFQPQNCEDTSTTKALPNQIQIGDFTNSTGFFGIKQRVMFSMPWITQEKPPKVELHDQAQQVAMRIVSAQYYDNPLFAQQLAGSIVVIGGSYQEGHDIHWTPLEEMPGALIIINAIHTLLEYGELQPLPMAVKILTYLILVVLMSFILARFGYSRGTFILALFVIFILIPSSILLFRFGIWLDFMLPLAVVMHLLPL